MEIFFDLGLKLNQFVSWGRSVFAHGYLPGAKIRERLLKVKRMGKIARIPIRPAGGFSLGR